LQEASDYTPICVVGRNKRGARFKRNGKNDLPRHPDE
jgi:hypothetical protein